QRARDHEEDEPDRADHGDRRDGVRGDRGAVRWLALLSVPARVGAGILLPDGAPDQGGLPDLQRLRSEAGLRSGREVTKKGPVTHEPDPPLQESTCAKVT